MTENGLGSVFAILHLSEEVNDAIALRSTLRNAGFHANVQHATDLDQAFEQAQKHDPHVTVIELGAHSQEMLEAMLRDGDSPFLNHAIILALDVYDVGAAEAAVEAGARDVVPVDSDALLKHAIVREVRAENYRRELEGISQLLRGAEGRCQKLIDGTTEPVTYVLDGLHVYANQAYLDLMEFGSVEELEDEPLLDHVTSADAARLRDFLKEEEGSGDFTLMTRNGNEVSAQLSSMRASYDGEECLQIFVSKKIDESALNEQMEFLSQRDLLTGLYNRNYFFDRVKSRLEALRSADNEDQAALLHLEVANIEEMRKHVGTTGIDSFLTDYGKEVEKVVGEEALVARHGAYSFLVLLGEADQAQATQVAEALSRHANDFVFSMEQVSLTINVAIGAVMIDSNSPGVMELVDRVERASQNAAGKGRNEFEFYRADLKSASERELEEEWSRRIRSALKDNRFFMVYQPIISLGSDREHNRFEVFLRMLDEEGQELSPSNFILRAERTELIVAIDRWLVLSSLKKITDAMKKGERLQLFIRISVQSLQEPGFGKWLAERLSAVRLPETLLYIQVRSDDAGYLVKQLNELQSAVSTLGCELLLDSFGESRDEHTLLGHVKPGVIKASRSLMNHFSSNADNQEAIENLIEVAREREIKVIVPNVEDAGTLQMLWGMGVDFVQGDFIQAASDSADFDFSSF